MQKESDGYDHDEGARPSSLRAVHKLSTPDPCHDLQLLRDLEIINARTLRELGPPPPADTPVEPKRRPNLSGRQPDDVGMVIFPAPPTQDGATDLAHRKPKEHEPMNLQHLAMTAALSMVTTDALATHGSKADPKHPRHPKPVDVERTIRYVQVDNPVWPDNGIAERILGDGDETWPENMFVEVAKGKLYAWVLMSPVQGQAKALDFFSGEVQDVKVKKPGDYNDAFVDAHGVTHRDNATPLFNYKEPKSRGWMGGMDFSGVEIQSKKRMPYAPHSLTVSRFVTEEETVVWSKLPFYKRTLDGIWNSEVYTALHLRDGTMLIAADKYIFRVRETDMSPVGEAPHLHVVDAEDARRVMQEADDKDIVDVNGLNAYIAERLNLN